METERSAWGLAQCNFSYARLSLFVLLCSVGIELTQGHIEQSHDADSAKVVLSKVKFQDADFNASQLETASEGPLNALPQQTASSDSGLFLQGTAPLSSFQKQDIIASKRGVSEDGESPVMRGSSLDILLQDQLRKLNQVLAEGDVRELLRFCAPNVRMDPPDRPGVQGHGADLVFALQTLFAEEAHRSVIQEEVIQLREVRLKGQNDPKKEFLLTRNSFPGMNKTGVTQAGKAVILWELLSGLAQTETNPNFEANDAKGRLLIRWWIWNDDGDSQFDEDSVSIKMKARRGTVRIEQRAEMGRRTEKGLRSSSLRSLYCSLRERWSDFNHALTQGDLTGCLDLTSPDTVIMPPGNPALGGSELKEVCEAFVQAGVTQQVDINEALLFKGRRIVRGAGISSPAKIKYFVLENDAFVNTYAQSNTTESGKQVIFWEVHPRTLEEGNNGSPLSKGTLKWGWTIWNSDAPEST